MHGAETNPTAVMMCDDPLSLSSFSLYPLSVLTEFSALYYDCNSAARQKLPLRNTHMSVGPRITSVWSHVRSVGLTGEGPHCVSTGVRIAAPSCRSCLSISTRQKNSLKQNDE